VSGMIVYCAANPNPTAPAFRRTSRKSARFSDSPMQSIDAASAPKIQGVSNQRIV